MPGKEAGKAKPLKQKVRTKEKAVCTCNSTRPQPEEVASPSRSLSPHETLPTQKAQAKDYTDEDKAHLQKKKEEAAALKAARDALLKGKKK